MIRRLLALLCACAAVAAFAAPAQQAAAPAPLGAPEAVAEFGARSAARPIVLRTTTDIAILAPTIEAFLANRPDLALRYEQWGSNDLYARSARDCAEGRSGQDAGADLVISSGAHQMVKLVNDGCAASWRSPATAALPASLRWRDQIWGVSREPAVIVYNRALVPPGEVPASRFDLLDLLRPEGSRYAGRVATYDIEASGLGFLFAFMDSQEASSFGALMEAFARSGAVATCCSAEIIAGVASGKYLVAYNMLGSYAAEAARLNPELGIVAPTDYTLVLSRAAILPGAVARPEAGALLDFILSEPGQRALAAAHLAATPSVPLPGSDGEQDDGRWRLIALGPTLLVAMDQMKAAGFLARWHAALGE